MKDINANKSRSLIWIVEDLRNLFAGLWRCWRKDANYAPYLGQGMDHRDWRRIESAFDQLHAFYTKYPNSKLNYKKLRDDMEDAMDGFLPVMDDDTDMRKAISKFKHGLDGLERELNI